jgi:hypothetical protein
MLTILRFIFAMMALPGALLVQSSRRGYEGLIVSHPSSPLRATGLSKAEEGPAPVDWRNVR